MQPPVMSGTKEVRVCQLAAGRDAALAEALAGARQAQAAQLAALRDELAVLRRQRWGSWLGFPDACNASPWLLAWLIIACNLGT